MTSIVESILKCTFGVLFNKGRDLVAEKLKDGDVTDQEVRKLISRELKDLQLKIDGLARRDLLASFSFFKEGIEILYRLFFRLDAGKVVMETKRGGVGMKHKKLTDYPWPSLASYASKLSVNTNLNELSHDDKQILLAAKERFKNAREKAVEAFSNDALRTSDRLLAMKFHILATIMEQIDCPATTLELCKTCCKLCLEDLHKMPVVQKCFSVEMTKTAKYWFNKRERREIIADVCHMNYTVHKITRILKGDLLDQLLFITIDHLQIDPLRDPRLIRALKKFKLEHCILPAEWTFGSEGEPSEKLWRPFSITTNTQGQFIVADYENVKVFDPHGTFLFSLFSSDKLKVKASALDRNDNLYLCIGWERKTKIHVFNQEYQLVGEIPLRADVSTAKSLTINNDQVFVVVQLDNDVVQVDVYESENDGSFVRSFGENVLSQTLSLHPITTCGDDVMILDAYTKCVHLFSAQGAHLYKFQLNRWDRHCDGIVFFEPSQHVLIASLDKDENRGQLSIYTKDGEFVRSVQLDTERKPLLFGLTVTVEGQVAVTNYYEEKIHVLQL